jgi:MEDS: MEthanogen/methylotroph, DcmR Sensory domain
MSESSLAGHIDAEACPHLAVFLRGPDELPAVLASFFALGVRRDGWLAHRALPGNADRERELLTEAGLDVAGLEADGRMVIVEMDFSGPVEDSALPWLDALDDALARGRTGLWYGRFPVGATSPYHEAMLAVERVWHRTFRDRPVVTLCPYIVGELDGGDTIATLGRVAESHTGVLLPDGDGGYGVLRPG